VSDIDYFVQMAYVSNPLREPVLRSAIQALQFPSGSRGLDAGCGIGLQTLLLAEAMGPAGHITGLDLSPEFLDHAEEMVENAGLSERISFREGDVNKLPFDDDTFDWAWSVDCVGYAPIEPLPLVKELARRRTGRTGTLVKSFQIFYAGNKSLSEAVAWLKTI